MAGSCPDDYTFGPGVSCRDLDFTLRFSNLLVSFDDGTLTCSFLSFVPALIYVIYALPRLIYILPRKKRRLLPLKDLPTGGIILLGCRIALALSLCGINIALAIKWEGSSVLGGEYSGRAAWILEIIAAVSHQSSDNPLMISWSPSYWLSPSTIRMLDPLNSQLYTCCARSYF